MDLYLEVLAVYRFGDKAAVQLRGPLGALWVALSQPPDTDDEEAILVALACRAMACQQCRKASQCSYAEYRLLRKRLRLLLGSQCDAFIMEYAGRGRLVCSLTAKEKQGELAAV